VIDLELSVLVTVLSMPLLLYLAVATIYRGVVVTQEASRRIRYSVVVLGQINLAFVLAMSVHVLLSGSPSSSIVYLAAICVALAYALCGYGAVTAALKLVSARGRIAQSPGWDVLSDKMVLLEFYRIWASFLAGLTVRISGMQNIKKRLESLSEQKPLYKKIELSEDGSVLTGKLAEQLDQLSEESITYLFTTPLNMMFRFCRGIYGANLLDRMREIARRMPLGHAVFEQRPEILNMLFGGMLVEGAGTGTEWDRSIGRGFPVGSSVLLLGDAGTDRDRFATMFLERALEAGYGVVYVTSFLPPEEVEARFPRQANLRIVDCHTALAREVAYSHQGRVFVCPNMAVLAHAVRDAIDDLGPLISGGRAVGDLLPSYLAIADVAEVWRSLGKVVSAFRASHTTCLFTAGPDLLQTSGGGTMEELFDSVVEVIGQGGHSPGIRVRKMAPAPYRPGIVPDR